MKQRVSTTLQHSLEYVLMERSVIMSHGDE